MNGIGHWSILAVLLLVMQTIALGQSTAQNAPAPGASDPGTDAARTAPATALSALVGMESDIAVEDTNTDLPQIPAALGGRGASLAFITEMERSNYLRGGVNVTAGYDDNPLLVPSEPESNTSETVFGNLSLAESTSRMRWMLGYAGGLTINQKITSQNDGSHNLNFDSQFRLSPHVNLRVAENFSVTTGLFDAGTGEQAITGAGGPNGSLLTPLSTQTSTVTTVEANYHVLLNDLIGASGSYYELHFANAPTGAQLADSQTASAAGFWLHKVFRGDWAGLSYRFQRITFDPNGETQVHTFSLVDTLRLLNGFSVIAMAGPQYVENQGLVPGGTALSQSNLWTVAGGIEGGWSNQRTSVTAGYSRTISDGGGILGAERLENVHANFRREFVKGWAATLMASHGVNDALTVPFAGTATSINLTSAGVGVERNVGKSFGLRVGYTHDFQQEYGMSAPNANLSANRNRVFVTLSYQWAKPLGM